ncbi:MAG: quinol:electron acceptor oxidoreductase subunit ActD [candidate division WOR-3 bacterium]
MRITFDSEKEFLEKYRELIERGIRREKIKTFTPCPVKNFHDRDKGVVKYFTLIGSITGFLMGIFLTTISSLEWNEILGGKKPLSIPAFIIIYYELVILFGAVFSFIGFLILKGLNLNKILKGEEFKNEYIIEIEEK